MLASLEVCMRKVLGRPALIALVILLASPSTEVVGSAGLDRVVLSPCSKVGVVKNVGKTSFICVKVSKRLVWKPKARSSGAESESSGPSTSTTVPDLYLSGSISASDKLLGVSECKLVSAVTSSFSSGFPRSSSLPSSIGNLKVLIVPIEFDDLKFDDATASALKTAYIKVAKYFEAVSYSQASIEPTFIDKRDAVVFAGPASSHMRTSETETPLVRQAISRIQSRMSTAGFDLVSFVTGIDGRQFGSEGFSAGSGMYSTNASFPATIDTGENVAKWRIIAHEIGHA